MFRNLRALCLRGWIAGFSLSVMLALGGCANEFRQASRSVDNKVIGSLAGAALGGFAGSQFGKGSGKAAATAIGTLLGGLAGHSIGSRLDERDEFRAKQAAQNALESTPSGQSQAWANPDSGNTGTITPGRPYYTAAGQPCRPFQHDIVVEGRTESITGRACRNPDGSWRVEN